MTTPDHFERLGFPRRFALDPAAVEREYLARSRTMHPDFHQMGSEAEQLASLEQTAALNEAYLTLREPVRRAESLLVLFGGPTSQQEKSLDQMFLMEMMDLREQLEAATAAQDPATLGTLNQELSAREQALLAQIAAGFERYDLLPDGSPDRLAILAKIRQCLNAIKTVRSLLRDWPVE